MNRNYKAKETMLTITVGLLIIYYFSNIKSFLTASVIIGIIGILSFNLSEKIDSLWQKLSYYLGEISNRILLTIIFFVVVTPIGAIRRLAKKKTIKNSKKGLTTYFYDRNHVFSKKDMENMW